MLLTRFSAHVNAALRNCGRGSMHFNDLAAFVSRVRHKYVSYPLCEWRGCAKFEYVISFTRSLSRTPANLRNAPRAHSLHIHIIEFDVAMIGGLTCICSVINFKSIMMWNAIRIISPMQTIRLPSIAKSQNLNICVNLCLNPTWVAILNKIQFIHLEKIF